MGKTTAHMPDKGLGEFDQTAGNADMVHDFAGQNKERHGKEREYVQTVKHLAWALGQEHPPAHVKQADNTRHTKGKADRHAQNHQNNKDNGDDHSAPSARSTGMKRP